MPEEAVERNRRIEIAGDSWLFAGFRVSEFHSFKVSMTCIQTYIQSVPRCPRNFETSKP
jgi:hypothetical protein